MMEKTSGFYNLRYNFEKNQQRILLVKTSQQQQVITK